MTTRVSMTKPPDPTILNVSLDDLVEPEHNPNVMPETEYLLLVEAIKRVGFLQPVLVRRHGEIMMIVDGVHRTRAAKEVGMTHVPAVVVDINGEEAHALQIGMNRMRGELDLSKVAESLATLVEEGWSVEELTITGFPADEIDALIRSIGPEEDVLAGSNATEPDDTPEPQPKPFLLEIEFDTRADMTKAKRALKRAAGKGGALGAGLIRMIDGE